MTVGSRLREERNRLGHSQTDFAALAGAKKGTQISWEKDASSPTAQALVAFADAGADVLYILTGRRSPNFDETIAARISEQIDEFERRLLGAGHLRLPNEREETASQRTAEGAVNSLRALLHYDKHLMSDEMIERATNLLEIGEDPAKLSNFRAADFVLKRKRREAYKADLAEYLDGAPYEPSGAVLNLLVMLAVDYSVPVKLLAEVVWEVAAEMKDKLSATG